MIRVSQVPVQVYQACAAYALDTGEEVYVNDLCIGDDSRAFIHSITAENGKMKLNTIYLTADVHKSALKRCASDIEKVDAFMENKTRSLK